MQASAQLTGIVGPQVFQSRFGPTYKVSFAASIGLLAGAVASISVTWWLVARRDRLHRDEVEVADESSSDEVVQEVPKV